MKCRKAIREIGRKIKKNRKPIITTPNVEASCTRYGKDVSGDRINR